VTDEHTTVVDFVARGRSEEEWELVLVEEGPWSKDILEDQLKRVQGRLYGSVDAALDGQVADRFPESLGKKIVIQLDCYNLPRAEVEEFFARFSKGALQGPDYQKALRNSKFVRGIQLRVKFESIN
jgi:hypothetical protein